jgi:hypothetical protein
VKPAIGLVAFGDVSRENHVWEDVLIFKGVQHLNSDRFQFQSTKWGVEFSFNAKYMAELIPHMTLGNLPGKFTFYSHGGNTFLRRI